MKYSSEIRSKLQELINSEIKDNKLYGWSHKNLMNNIMHYLDSEFIIWGRRRHSQFHTKFITAKNYLINNKDKIIKLEPRYQKILEMRFGLIDGVSRTREEVGGEFGVTRERVRQIETKALMMVDYKDW